MNINIEESITKPVRDIPVGEYFIYERDLRSYRHNKKAIVAAIRQRTDNVFRSKNLYGSMVMTLPSEKAHPIEITSGKISKETGNV